MHFVYRFINKNNTVIYIGKTSQSLAQRFNLHEHLPAECYEAVEHIEYIECQSAAETQIKEVYYINLYKDNKPYYNILDVAEPIQGVMLNDTWTLYEGPLPPAFSHSWNRRVGLKSNGAGIAGALTVHHLTLSQINLMVEQYLLQIEKAWTPTLKTVALRNLLVFMLGINSPLRPKELASLRYRDLFYPNDTVRPLEYKLTRGEGDLTLKIQYPRFVEEIILLYREYASLSFEKNADDPICKSRQRDTPITINALARLVRGPAEAAGITSSVGSNTLRKTYLMNIYNSMDDKVDALLLLDRLNGGNRFLNVANYLGLEQASHGFDVICDAKYPCGSIDLTRLKSICLDPPSEANAFTNSSGETKSASQNLSLQPSEESSTPHPRIDEPGRQAYGNQRNSPEKTPSSSNQSAPIPASGIASLPTADQETDIQPESHIYSKVDRNGIDSWRDRDGYPISDEKLLEIKNYTECNPYFLYSELVEQFNISAGTLLSMLSEAHFE